MNDKLYFASDYMEGAHPEIMRRLMETNLMKSEGYGCDAFCEEAREKIREACGCPNAEVRFLVGGTQTNATVIDALLRGYQGVLAAESGHIGVHEAGAIEFGGHKVLTLPQKLGKISASDIESYMTNYLGDANREHTVLPGMVYISQPTEFGTLYSLAELREISGVCRRHALPLYLDGARLAYALACPENDAGLRDIAALCDAFYIGGTKCGALFGEAVVIPDKKLIPHFFTTIKQHGALLAKGRLLGIQFGTLFTNGLYLNIGENAISAADRIKAALKTRGVPMYFETPTNQIFIVLENVKLARLSEKIELGFWEKYDEEHTVMRIATSWATEAADVNRLIKLMEEF